MIKNSLQPENPAETFVYRAIIWTWPFYAFGALYVVGPVVGWVLAALVFLSFYLGPAIRSDLRVTGPVPPIVWCWILSMLVMLIALWAGHLGWGLGLKATIKSSIGWAKGWALLALFPLAGACLPIRRALLVRAQCVVGLWTLALAPLMLIAPYVGLPEKIWTSPLQAVGGPGPEYFTLYLYIKEPVTWAPRWQFYAPWAPFAALLGVISIVVALDEKEPRWKAIGIAAGILMILASKSRMGLIGMVACTVGPRMVPLIIRSDAWLALSVVTALLAGLLGWMREQISVGVQAFRGARADSTRVREALQRIAYERWQNEAVWFGHGTVHPGSHLVEFMPIGSHHTWYGLLFVKGLVGFFALLVPMLWHTGLVFWDAIRHPRGCLPLGIMMVLILLTFGENIEIEAYLLWPALMLLGLHAREVHDDSLALDRANADH